MNGRGSSLFQLNSWAFLRTKVPDSSAQANGLGNRHPNPLLP